MVTSVLMFHHLNTSPKMCVHLIIISIYHPITDFVNPLAVLYTEKSLHLILEHPWGFCSFNNRSISETRHWNWMQTAFSNTPKGDQWGRG